MCFYDMLLTLISPSLLLSHSLGEDFIYSHMAMTFEAEACFCSTLETQWESE